ncbi:Dynamin_N domain-containing protein [Fusarium acuminatum]|uniref:Dynamin_N domain-containing protein n=1 Tax=Fusarium acuminatum TaxID=5515 RepID=A0ABZ2XAM9_9HYPO
MEGEGAQAPSTPVKRERSPSPELDLNTPGNKRQSDEASGVVRAPVVFPWRTCQSLGYAERLKIKERAVERAEDYCQKVRAVLMPVLQDIAPNSPDAIMMGQRIIKQWCQLHDDIRHKHRKLEILVGVEGPTGAGKSSFLGSLLKIPELFPSGQESAATAVIGKVSWNWDDTPGREFIARVSFRKMSEIENDLESLLRELNHFASLMAGGLEDESDGTEQADNKAISRNMIDHHLPKVKAVWGLDEGNLTAKASKCPNVLAYNQMARQILRTNYEAYQFLVAGGTTFSASSAEGLSDLIKPFLDSSSETHGGRKQFAAWPLVKGVHIYAKSHILKPGITLVDLPGCGDAVESRSEVAEIAKRKAESQKKKAQRSYDSAVKKHAIKLQENPQASDEHITNLQTQKDELARAFEEADKALDQHDIRQSQIQVEMSYLRDWLYHRAIQTRNTRVMNRLRADFASRHNRHDDSDAPTQSQSEHEYVLPILPVSTRAFWQLENNDGPMTGFPNQMFTGVPAAEQWLHQATASKREKHLDGVLDGYQNLMTMMRIYSQTNGQDGDFGFTRAQVEEALAETHDIYQRKLSSKLKEACDLIEKLDPLERKPQAMKKFLANSYRIVLRWGYKFPEVENDVQKMHFGTYAANIRRNGAKYTSFSTPRVTYTWMENLGAPILKAISKDWDRKMNRKLPLIKPPMMAGYTEVFTEYLNEIQRLITKHVPALEAIFNGMRPILDNSQRATETDIGNVLDKLSQKASTIAFEAVAYLTDEMTPTFRAAAADTGTGCHQRRMNTIQEKVRTNADSMCREIFRRLEAGLAAKMAEVPAELEKAAAGATYNLKQQLSFLANNLAESFSDDPVKNAMKAKVQDGVRAHIESWESGWAEEGGYDEHILDKDLSIPASIPEPVMEEFPSSEYEGDEGNDSMEEDDPLSNDNLIGDENNSNLI